MTQYLHRRFPEFGSEIQALLTEDADFREACGNYEEICGWLAERCPETGSTSKECENARDLMNELEDEILTLLAKHHDEELHERS